MDTQKVYTIEEFEETVKERIEVIKKDHLKEIYRILYRVKQIN